MVALITVLVVGGFHAAPLPHPLGAEDQIERVNLTYRNTQSAGDAQDVSISGDGRFVAFRSGDRHLVPFDENYSHDVYVRDRLLRRTVRVSGNDSGYDPPGMSQLPSVSGNGRYVAFACGAELHPDDVNRAEDVYVRDLETRELDLVSVTPEPEIGYGHSRWCSISQDGRYVAFASSYRNLVPQDPNPGMDVFVRDRLLGVTTLIPFEGFRRGFTGSQLFPEISADGRFVAFTAYEYTVGGFGHIAVLFSINAYLHNRLTGETILVSGGQGGAPANGISGVGSISRDGRYVAFWSSASNLVPNDNNNALDVFVFDRQTRKTRRVSVASDGSEGNGRSIRASISWDGRFVAFESVATNLDPRDLHSSRDVFVHDLRTGRTELVSLSYDNRPGNADSHSPRISGDGRYVAFQSWASNLVPNDTNGREDAFVRRISHG